MSPPVFMMCKPPNTGTSKTRLAAGVGRDVGAAVAAMLADSVDRAKVMGHDVFLATTDVNAEHGVDTPKVGQGEGDFGQRIRHVAAGALVSHSGFILMGMDAPGWPAGVLAALVAKLEKFAIVLSEDGGFSMMYIPRLVDGLFLGLPWSAANTAQALRDQLQGLGQECDVVGHWSDVDTLADARRFLSVVPEQHAPRTTAALRRLLSSP